MFYGERLFVAGLLHDIGRLVMCLKVPDQLKIVYDFAEKAATVGIKPNTLVLIMVVSAGLSSEPGISLKIYRKPLPIITFLHRLKIFPLKPPPFIWQIPSAIRLFLVLIANRKNIFLQKVPGRRFSYPKTCILNKLLSEQRLN